MKNNTARKIVILLIAAMMIASCLLTLCACGTKTERYEVYKDETYVMGYGGKFMMNLIFSLAIDEENTYLELDNKGNLHIQLRTKAGLFGMVNELLDALSQASSDVDVSADDIAGMLEGFDVGGMVDSMVEPMFPGFRAKLEQGDLDGALRLIQRSLGFYLYGFDYSDPDFDAALKEIGRTMKLPANLLEVIPEDTQLTLTFDNKYYVKEVTGNDGTTYKALYIGDISNNPYTQPYGIFTVSEQDGKEKLTLRLEFMAVQLVFVAK